VFKELVKATRSLPSTISTDNEFNPETKSMATTTTITTTTTQKFNFYERIHRLTQVLHNENQL
jgi:hypothetical protein